MNVLIVTRAAEMPTAFFDDSFDHEFKVMSICKHNRKHQHILSCFLIRNIRDKAIASLFEASGDYVFPMDLTLNDGRMPPITIFPK